MTDRPDPAHVDRFRELVAAHLGLSFDPHGTDPRGTDPYGEVLRRRATRHGLSARGYLARLATAPDRDELAALAEALTITETYFFRHPEQLRALAAVVLPARLRARDGQRLLRLLSVGCSSGEEAYTLAILGLTAVPEPGWDVHVRGLDANPAVLRRAVAGRYSAWALRETPVAVRRRWFTARGQRYEVVPELRRRVGFVQHNVAADPLPGGEYDVICCRNLLMYLHPVVAQQLVSRMTRALAPGGALLLGHTDTLGARPAGLRVRDSHDAFYYERVPDPPAPGTGAAPAAAAPGPDAEAGGAAVPAARPAAGGDRRLATRLLREERYAEALAALPPAGADRPAALLRAVLLAHAGRAVEAVAACRELLAADGRSADAHHLLGTCVEEADPAAADQRYRLAARLDPDFAQPWLRLGVLAGRRGDRAAEREALARAIALLPGESDERILYFGGGFGRHALLGVCRGRIGAAGSAR
ncbi:hypothetical protein GCM10010123_06030 [Pilimelia anulata]|uniref:CheR-type methyltransferase domain-containing protein n=1 Tax=Pilimelia anulata TaxID=53371 RepID=A0A8J3B7J5_9ACTN|nr:protein-glutamate O-methyltransferase CheR [Pilimelia anulata]GGJ78911.1 hypothetical protein GCM10010123_06030 [Pilimelia anulata]